MNKNQKENKQEKSAEIIMQTNNEKNARNKRNIKSSERAITLVALVVTIIILLILAGVTIGAITSNTGLLSRTQEAKAKYENASQNDITALQDASDLIDSAQGIMPIQEITLEQAKADAMLDVTAKNSKVTIGTDTVYVPAKFKISSDSASTVSGGIVIEDSKQNQYVWIPVASISDYKRTDFAKGTSFANCSETMPNDEQVSVTKYGGYYIGRYEASIETARTASTTGTTMAQLGEVTEKANPSYTYVTRDQAKSLSEEISSHYGYSVTSKLCSSYAWDTALNFIDKTNSGYSTNSTQGNYSGSLKNTGLSTKVCNIYDMGGNVWEWTTETCSYAYGPCVYRGGYYNDSASDIPTGYRNVYSTSCSGSGIGFRPTLYL